MRFLIIILAGVILAGAVWYAPHYLTYADQPAKADVIVLFVGYDYNARKKEAMKLLADGYAQHMIVPAFGTMYGHSMLDKKPRLTRLSGAVGAGSKKTYPRFYEDTHVEILEARQMMEKTGFKSAIFVSSPFHMRRIKTIAGKVFDGSPVQVSFVPTRYEKKQERFWLFSNKGIEEITNEYIKIAWFFMYGTFS